MGHTDFVLYLYAMAYQLPLLAVYAAGCLLAIANVSRRPNASLLVLCGCAVLLIVSVVQPLVTQWYLSMAHTWRTPPTSALTAIAFVGICIRAVAVGCLLAAVFGDRRRLDAGQATPA